MKLLFDQNLPRRLSITFQSLFSDLFMFSTLDLRAHPIARSGASLDGRSFTIVTKDSDFTTLSLVDGAPPKDIWIALGNCSTSEIENALRSHTAAIEAFGSTGDDLILR